MEKVFHFDSPRAHYQSGGAVVWCFDHRFNLAFSKFLKRAGVEKADSIQVAGGAKCLASPGAEAEREFVLEQIRLSVRLHATKLAILMVHSDCGAYGGLTGGFDGDTRREAEHHAEELRRAAAVVQRAIPDIEVRGYFVDFEGVWESEGIARSGDAAR